MPFTGSSVEDMEQLRQLAQQYARQVPFGLDWPVNFWADKIGWETEDQAARVWLNAYFSATTTGFAAGQRHEALMNTERTLVAIERKWHGPDGWQLVADRRQVFPDDPGQGTPLMVYSHWGRPKAR